eukprot:GHVU01120430.1.p1 GENE.GHVU01120430.1~~GHVU01120430.1.p1  ORF type:complete len:160 (-),score=11.85 GHVU01120430.1:36-494(-)
MAPDEIEWFKADRADDAGARAEGRTRIERELSESAGCVLAIGPRLHNRFELELRGPASLHRLDPGFDSVGVLPVGPPPGRPHRILLVGRAEDEVLKGLDIAARSVGHLQARWSPDAAPFELFVRGAPENEATTLREKLQHWSGLPNLKVVVR